MISAISIFVPDLAAATRFYAEVLGFSVQQSFGDYATKLKSDGPSLLLCAGGPRVDVPYPAGVVLGHRTPNLDERIAELTKSVTFVQAEPQPFPAGRYVAFTDPFGIHHEVSDRGLLPRRVPFPFRSLTEAGTGMRSL